MGRDGARRSPPDTLTGRGYTVAVSSVIQPVTDRLEGAAAAPPRARPPSGGATWIWGRPNPKLGGGSRRNTPGSTLLGESHPPLHPGLDPPSRGATWVWGRPDPKLGRGSRPNTLGSTPLGESHVGLRAASSL
uniref:Uncharacterized protein n=1 Tax=Oryza sativa subsp. japonica TaxID=39947 RepID=Q655G0_ORYSJ|nr:hypothetical protein [Oryza sativa Japonica Group]